MIKRKKQLIGRRELIDFPDFNLKEIEAKIDTGAYTSALHCSYIRLLNHNGKEQLSVVIFDLSPTSASQVPLTFTDFDLREIKSSFGDVQKRYVIKTRVKMFNKIFEAEFSLTDRSDLKYPVLIGRTLLQGRFIVDVSKKNLSYKAQRNKAQNS